jgi:hypothetical protein
MHMMHGEFVGILKKLLIEMNMFQGIKIIGEIMEIPIGMKSTVIQVAGETLIIREATIQIKQTIDQETLGIQEIKIEITSTLSGMIIGDKEQ